MKTIIFKIFLFIVVVSIFQSISIWILAHNTNQTQAALDFVNGGTAAFNGLQTGQIEKQWVPGIAIGLSILAFLWFFLGDLHCLWEYINRKENLNE